MRREYTLEDQARDRYPCIEFDVPSGTTSVSVTIVVEGDGVVDLGCEGPNGWRGWSGGARRHFVIRDDDATPGYLPGVLEPGVWKVVLGLHALPAGRVTVRATVTLDSDERPDHGACPERLDGVRRGSELEIPAPPGLQWFAGDTHTHSIHSDGTLSLAELARLGVASGLDFLCVTDHNTTSHHRLLEEAGARQGIVLVPGQEVTTHRGHANVFGDVGFVDFRLPADDWVATTAGRGGIMSINHPVSGDCSWLHPLSRFPAGIELVHSDWWRDRQSTAVLAWAALSPDNTVLLGGSDFHRLEDRIRPGVPTTWVAASDCTSEAILEGIRAGRTTVTASAREVDGSLVPVHDGAPLLVRIGERLLVRHADGLVLVDGDGRRWTVPRPDWEVRLPVGQYRLEDPTRAVLAMSR